MSRRWNHIVTLAAAYAEVGDWENAVEWQKQSIELAIEDDDRRVGQQRLELFESRQPYREAPQTKQGDANGDK